MPAGFMAAIAEHESGGRFDSAGDISLGEVGFFQITQDFPKQFGIDPDVRRQYEGNIFLAGLEYNAYAARLANAYPNEIAPGTKDQWYVSRLAFAVGYYGTENLIKNSRPHIFGQVWQGIQTWIERTGGMPLGSQSADKVKARVKDIDVQWLIGNQVIPASWTGPRKVPAYAAYSVPSWASGMLAPIIGSAILAAGALSTLYLLD